MNARELRHAAGLVLGDFSHPYGWSGMIEDSKRLAEHILATVRDDDDEPVSEEWFRSVSTIANIFGPTIHYQGRYLTWFEWGIGYYDNDTDAVPVTTTTRGQFRALCKGLGIELKEGDRETE